MRRQSARGLARSKTASARVESGGAAATRLGVRWPSTALCGGPRREKHSCHQLGSKFKLLLFSEAETSVLRSPL